MNSVKQSPVCSLRFSFTWNFYFNLMMNATPILSVLNFTITQSVYNLISFELFEFNFKFK